MPFSDFPDERELVPYEASTFAANRVVVFAPHPDDEVLGCGGALADLLDRGAHLDVVLVTDGAAEARDAGDRGRIAAMRMEESRRALDPPRRGPLPPAAFPHPTPPDPLPRRPPHPP